MKLSSRMRACVGFVALAVSIACSAPSLEDPRCAEAQDRVRRFYSLHFDSGDTPGEMSDSARAFVTERLAARLDAQAPSEGDYFTSGERFPKAFRVGKCTLLDDESADLEVLLLWRTDDERSLQRSVRVKARRVSGLWLIDAVEPLQ